jgi:hypothetical protein
MTIWCADLDETKRSFIQSLIDTVNSPDDGYMAARKNVENRNKHTWKRVVRRVGYLQEKK